MKPPTRIPLLSLSVRVNSTLPTPAAIRLPLRSISSTPLKPADVAPIVGTGPPPAPPQPAAEYSGPRNKDDPMARVARRRRQAELLKNAKEARGGLKTPNAGMKRRFWKDVSVQEVDGALQIHLDSRPLRHPVTKEIIRLPVSKPHLASALAIEWDMLTSAQQATKQHLIPLTSLVCRALDIADDDAGAKKDDAAAPFSAAGEAGDDTIRKQIATTLMRYLDTDSLLCFAPEAEDGSMRNKAGESLREVQERTANEVLGYMKEHVWPGVEIVPVLDGNSIMPRKQAENVRDTVHRWVESLGPFELAGLERAVLAGKSLLAASRLVVEWSEHEAAGSLRPAGENPAFGVEEATKATSAEVDWQTGNWGEVEDTHDVEKEDLRRQLGSVVLLVSGVDRR